MANESRLSDLSATIHREHDLARGANGDMLRHAIAAGEALIEAKRLVPSGEWIAWIVENAPAGKGYWCCQSYMRLATLKDQVDPGLSIGANLRLLTGVDGASPGRPKVEEDVKAEALRLYGEGNLSHYEIARRVGVSRSTVRCWINPDWAREKEQRRNRPHRAPLRVAEPGEKDLRAFRYGEPGRTALGRAVRQLALAAGKDAVHEALLDLAAIANAWAERLVSRYGGPGEEAA